MIIKFIENFLRALGKPLVAFLSSLGDLSTKYFDQFEIPTARRLLDLNLGSDIEGYFNNRSMANFIINGSMYDAGGKLNENRKDIKQVHLPKGCNIQFTRSIIKFKTDGTPLPSGTTIKIIHKNSETEITIGI